MPLHYYAKRGNIAAMRVALRNGAKVDPTPDMFNPTPLHYAARWNIDAVKLLLEHGSGMDVKNKDWGRVTRLHRAAGQGRTDVVRLLLERWPEGAMEKDE
jgi:ankyrin repeat protein